ncbi:SDR family oxidoreductase [Uliginosibacterium sp. sgz301328]|uniref:SDR family oxidoreductase n=1 Tax=Uliginosibacterium sp. sgz301328 TaxID=3243764 RepID=UPI00359DE693
MNTKRRLLIIGAGDVAQRVARQLGGRYRLFALVRQAESAQIWRALGARPIIGDLDATDSLRRLAGVADIVLHCAPPPATGNADPRTRRLLAALGRGQSLPCGLIYISTTGVYGDCRGALIDETRQPHPTTPRARRRIAAEKSLRAFGARCGVPVAILRAPGIYASDRLPLDRLRRADPVLRQGEDVFTNHIHAEDLAAAAIRAITRAAPGRVYNAVDHSDMPMGDFYDLLADSFALPRPPRMTRLECAARLGPATLSFMSESRRIANNRLVRELGVRLRYPSVADGIRAAVDARSKSR